VGVVAVRVRDAVDVSDNASDREGVCEGVGDTLRVNDVLALRESDGEQDQVKE
jgi:hypothetical protein